MVKETEINLIKIIENIYIDNIFYPTRVKLNLLELYYFVEKVLNLTSLKLKQRWKVSVMILQCDVELCHWCHSDAEYASFLSGPVGAGG